MNISVHAEIKLRKRGIFQQESFQIQSIRGQITFGIYLQMFRNTALREQFTLKQPQVEKSLSNIRRNYNLQYNEVKEML